MNTLALTAAAVTVLVLFSAFFSASETSLTSISRLAVRKIKKEGTPSSLRIVRILSKRNRMITTILIGNNLVNIWASSLATAFAIERYGEEGVAIATAAMTLILLVFAELTPKALASRYPIALARSLAPGVAFFQVLFAPFALAFTGINSLFIALLNALSRDKGHRLTEDEIRTMVDLGERDGALEARERHLLQRAFDLTNRRVREIMTPRTAVVSLPEDADAGLMKKTFRDSGFSRLPVYRDTLDGVTGVLHFKDLLPNAAENRSAGELAREALFVPETQTIPALLSQLDRHRQHLAVVVDERGSIAGIVTLDDAVSSIFGTLGSRADREEPSSLVQVLSPSHLKVPGKLRLDDLNALLKTSLDSDYYETLGGYLLENLGRLPVPGDRLQEKGLCMTVEEVVDRAVSRVEIVLTDKKAT